MALSNIEVLFQFSKLLKELQLRVLTLTEPSTLMNMRLTNHTTRHLINRNRAFLIKGVIREQYPELRMLFLKRTGPLLSEPDTDEVPLRLQADLDLWMYLTRKWRTLTSEGGEGVKVLTFTESLDVEALFIDTQHHLSSENTISTSLNSRPKFPFNRDFGYLSLVVDMRTILDDDISVLVNRGFVSESDISGAKRDQLRCALLLLWRLRCPAIKPRIIPGKENPLAMCDSDKLDIVLAAPKAIYQTLQGILRDMIEYMASLPESEHHNFRKMYEPPRWTEEGLSESEKSSRRRREVCVKRQHHRLILENIIGLGARAMANADRIAATYDPVADRVAALDMMLQWTGEDARLSEEESQCLWESQPLVLMGFLPKSI